MYLLDSFDHVIVAFSGGKDSTALVLHILDLGVPKEKIELWHHDVEGHSIIDAMTDKEFEIFSSRPAAEQRELARLWWALDDSPKLFDWDCTPAYCQKFADEMGLPIYFSWKQKGLRGEMMRFNAPPFPTIFETPHGFRKAGGNTHHRTTRLKFPAKAGLNNGRYCSAIAKIGVCKLAYNNQERFRNSRTLIVTGERAQESSNRSKLKRVERYASHGNRNRHCFQWRAIHSWSEEQVWARIEKGLNGFSIQAHPAYRMGFGRLSCQFCIFSSANQWQTNKYLEPKRYGEFVRLEQVFDYTLDNKRTIPEMTEPGAVYSSAQNPALQAEARDRAWNHDILIPHSEWQLPPGAFGENAGPT